MPMTQHGADGRYHALAQGGSGDSRFGGDQIQAESEHQVGKVGYNCHQQDEHRLSYAPRRGKAVYSGVVKDFTELAETGGDAVLVGGIGYIFIAPPPVKSPPAEGEGRSGN